MVAENPSSLLKLLGLLQKLFIAPPPFQDQ